MSDTAGPIELKDVVRQGRERLGLTQVDFAAAVEMSQRWVSDLERGVIKTPRPDTMRRMADALRIDVADLIIASGQARTKADANRVAASDMSMVASGRGHASMRLDTSALPIDRRVQQAIMTLKLVDLEYDNRISILESMLNVWRDMDMLRQFEEESR